MDIQDTYYKEMVATQIVLANKHNVLEMEYELAKHPPINMYDCLIARMKENILSKPEYAPRHYEEKRIVQRDADVSLINSN